MSAQREQKSVHHREQFLGEKVVPVRRNLRNEAGRRTFKSDLM